MATKFPSTVYIKAASAGGFSRYAPAEHFEIPLTHEIIERIKDASAVTKALRGAVYLHGTCVAVNQSDVHQAPLIVDAQGNIDSWVSLQGLQCKPVQKVTIERLAGWLNKYPYNVSIFIDESGVKVIPARKLEDLAPRQQANCLFWGEDSGFDEYLTGIERSESNSGLAL